MTPAFLSTQYPYVLSIPIDDIELSDDRRFRIRIDGKSHIVAYHAELECWFLLEHSSHGFLLTSPVWRTEPGRWHIGTRDIFPQRPKIIASQRYDIVLPPVVHITPNAQPIPRTIHYIWIGENGIPDRLVRRMLKTTRYCHGYRVVLHAHAATMVGSRRLQEQFSPQSGIEVADLLREPHFKAFLQSTLGKFYRYFIGEEGRNYGAASDILRVHILHREGGIYLDVDDHPAHSIDADMTLLAGPNDILLNGMVSRISTTKSALQGYNNSNFACNPGNFVLAEILKEMEQRLGAEKSLPNTPYQWCSGGIDGDKPDAARALVYINTIFRLTGPALLNDVLRALRPDYYQIERDLLYAFHKLTVSPSEPRVISDNYFNTMLAAKAFYLPFSEPGFHIKTGSAASWLPSDVKEVIINKFTEGKFLARAGNSPASPLRTLFDISPPRP
ncbi:glycosyltransferase family 32 protein [Burkholderia cepacia]|uniref:glycosyltransferase family 32 protein n=1 Tax=Burkholderia cepacia TaxID=292 RepID=UPI0009BBD54A|nr:TcdA/TcdB catalytic glycosyltransferase domain-containing protein [Burkholderia cepacia]